MTEKSNDWYSPRHVIRDLFEIDGRFGKYRLMWECAQGDGRLVEEMKRLGYQAVGSDIIDGVDFLDPSSKRRVFGSNDVECDVITNPPYEYATEFVLRAFEVARFSVAMLIPLEYLCRQSRAELFDEGFTPGEWKLSCIYPYTYRPRFVRPDGTTPYTPNFEVAWFVWHNMASCSPHCVVSVKRIYKEDDMNRKAKRILDHCFDNGYRFGDAQSWGEDEITELREFLEKSHGLVVTDEEVISIVQNYRNEHQDGLSVWKKYRKQTGV